MKIAQIVPSLEAHQGGTSVSVPQLAGALAGLDHAVELFTTGPAAAEIQTEGNLRIETFRRDWPQRICPSAGLRLRLERTDAEIIHHHSLWLRTLHYAHRRAGRSGAKLVVSPRGMMNTWAWQHRRWRKQIARALIHPGALGAVDGWHATSTEEAADIKAHGFNQPICVAPNGVNAPDVSARARDTAHWLARCPEAGSRPVALFYSRFHQKKRVLELIDLWLERAPPDWLLLLVGIAQDYTPETLEQYILRASGSGRIKVFSGEDQPPPYALASLFLLPSHSENFGLVIAEAMAHGVPALVTDGTPWNEINRDERGWCVAWSAYGDALQSATAEPHERLRERGERARQWVVAEFSWQRSARLLADFYRSLKEVAP
jgi:glycosyltransferase involved in cell wall biosynthesis